MFVFVPLMMTADNPLRCQNIFLYEEAEEREKTIALTVGHVVLSSLEINAHLLPSPPLYIFYAKENGHYLLPPLGTNNMIPAKDKLIVYSCSGFWDQQKYTLQ